MRRARTRAPKRSRADGEPANAWKQTSIQVTPELWRRGRIRAIEEHVEWRELVRRALELYLATPPVPPQGA
jgi:hypothetical protein